MKFELKGKKNPLFLDSVEYWYFLSKECEGGFLLKRAYDRNFQRDQLFATSGNLDVTNHPYSGILLLFVYLDCIAEKMAQKKEFAKTKEAGWD